MEVKLIQLYLLQKEEYELQTIQFPYFDSQGDGIFERPIPTKKLN